MSGLKSNAAWDYGGFHNLYDMKGPIYLPNNSIVQVCDWTEFLPDFMKEADTIFVDPPWNIGNVNSFYTKADKEHSELDFLQFTDAFFSRIDEINPRHLFVEMGKEYLDVYISKCKNRYRYVTFYNSNYYNKSSNKCYVIQATNEYKLRRYDNLEDNNDESIVAWICKNHIYNCIGDLCMGRGLVGKCAYLNRKRFVGTELNEKRLANLVHIIRQKEDF